MMMSNELKRDEAIGWHVRVSDPNASAQLWEEFTGWLEADPDNAKAYDAVAFEDAELSHLLQISPATSAIPQNDNETAPPRWYQRRGMLAVAASAALALVASPFLLSGGDFQRYETRPGETREIALSDGSHIVLNGGTSLSLDAKSNRFAKLESGEAIFTIRHDAANPFVVESAGATLRDLGTIFNVRQDDDGIDVSVAEGAVQYNPASEAITIATGRRLRVARDHPIPLLSKTEAGAIGGWRQGRLTYEDVPLSSIAVDLSRSLGTPVSVGADIGGRRFSGVIQIDRDQYVLFRRIESLIGVRARHSAKGWQLTS
jgi:transmembrane sensor